VLLFTSPALQAIPSGPRRKQLQAWTSPDLTDLTRNIRTKQLAHQQKQRQQDLADQQSAQQELARNQQEQLQETVLKQQQQLDQLIHLLAQPAATTAADADAINSRSSLRGQPGQLLAGTCNLLDGGLLGAAAAKLSPLLAAEGLNGWAAYTGGFRAASEALAAAAAATAGANGGGSSSSSPTHLQQLIMQRQQQLAQQGLPQHLLQLLATAASASGAQTATAVAAATAAAAAASKLPASSIVLLLQEAAANLLAQQQQQQQCCQGGGCSCCCCQQGVNKASGSAHRPNRSRRSNNCQAAAAEPLTGNSSCTADAVDFQGPAGVDHARGLYRSSTCSSMASSNAEYACAEQGQVRGQTLGPTSVELPAMSLSVRLNGVDGEDAHHSRRRVMAGFDSKQQQQQQQLLGVGLKPLEGLHRLRGRCSFTVDNPLFQLEINKSSAAAAGPAAAAAGSLLGGSSGSSLGSSSSSRHCSTLYLSPAAAETICQAAAAAASAAAAAVRSAVTTLDAEDWVAASDAGGGECAC
jgi:hypothetical protein